MAVKFMFASFGLLAFVVFIFEPSLRWQAKRKLREIEERNRRLDAYASFFDSSHKRDRVELDRTPVDNGMPYRAKNMLTKTEQILLENLHKVYPSHFIFSQVSLYSFLKIPKGPQSLYWFRRISQLSADFVICDQSCNVLRVIELDDWTHDNEARKITDAKKNKAIASAGIEMVRIQADAIPAGDSLKLAIGLN